MGSPSSFAMEESSENVNENASVVPTVGVHSPIRSGVKKRKADGSLSLEGSGSGDKGGASASSKAAADSLAVQRLQRELSMARFENEAIQIRLQEAESRVDKARTETLLATTKYEEQLLAQDEIIETLKKKHRELYEGASSTKEESIQEVESVRNEMLARCEAAEEERDELSEANERMTQRIKELTKSERLMQTELLAVKEELARVQSEAVSSSRRSPMKGSKMEADSLSDSDSNPHAVEVEQLKQQVQQLQSKLQLRSEELSLMDSYKDSLRETSERDADYRRLIEEHRVFSEKASSIPLLEEENRELKATASRAAEAQRRWSELKVEHDLLQEEVTSWKATFAKICSSSSLASSSPSTSTTGGLGMDVETNNTESVTPQQVEKSVRELQDSYLKLLNSTGESNGEHVVLSRRVEEMEREVTELRQKLKAAEHSAETNEKMLSAERRRVECVTRNRDGLREILDTYSEEAALSSAMAVERSTGDGDGEGDENVQKAVAESKEVATVRKLLQESERTAAEWEQIAKSLQLEGFQTSSSSSSSTSGGVGSGAESNDLTAEVEALQNENKKLNKLLNKAEQEAASLEKRVLVGEYNPRTTKVVHMKFNPHKVAKDASEEQKVRELEDEVKDLTQKLNILQVQLKREQEKVKAAKKKEKALEEEYANATSDFTTTSHSTFSDITTVDINQALRANNDLKGVKAEVQEWQKRYDELQVALGEKDKKLDRLRTHFKQTTKEYRGVCASITGWHVEIAQQDTFTARSLYSSSKDEKLFFQKDEEGNFSLLSSPYAQTLSEDSMEVLRLTDSIPAFLAQACIDRFN